MAGTQVYKFKMEMSCQGCANAAKSVLTKLGEPVKSVETNLNDQTVVVETDLPMEQILKALEKTKKKVTVLN